MDYCEHGVWPMSKNNKMKAYIRYCDLDGCNRDRNYIADCEHSKFGPCKVFTLLTKLVWQLIMRTKLN